MKNTLEKSTSRCKYEKCNGDGMIFTENNTVKFCDCYYDSIMDNRLKFANIPEEFKDLRINQFQTEIYTTEEYRERARNAKIAAANFVKNFKDFETQAKGLYLYSYKKGSGKTRMAASIGNALINYRKKNVKYINTLDLLSEIKSTYNKDTTVTESELIYQISKVDVLILDDIGVEGGSSWVNEKFYSIINGRMVNEKVTIFTSNCKIEELKQDERIKNRIEKMAIPIAFPDESIRSQIAKRENESLQDVLFKRGN